MIEEFVLAPSYSRLSTTIASTGLNCRVRNENGCNPTDEAPEQNLQSSLSIRNWGSTKHGQAKKSVAPPDRIRTCDMGVFGPLLYQTELRGTNSERLNTSMSILIDTEERQHYKKIQDKSKI